VRTEAASLRLFFQTAVTVDTSVSAISVAVTMQQQSNHFQSLTQQVKV
jgi:hypothetical protein